MNIHLPPGLRARIQTQARNLLFAHRIERHPVGLEVAEKLLVAQGELIAELVIRELVGARLEVQVATNEAAGAQGIVLLEKSGS